MDRQSFDQRLLNYANRPTRSVFSGDGGKGMMWNLRWSPTKNSTKLLLMPGKYLDFELYESPFYQYVEHFVSYANTGFICSRKYKMEDGFLSPSGGKCLACKLIEEGSESISTRICHAFNGVHLEYYHSIPLVRNGKEIVYNRGQNAGKSIMEEVVCTGRRCIHCANSIAKNFGRRIYWSIGKGHLGDLTGYIAEIRNTCKCGGELFTIGYECDKCGEPIVVLDKTTMNDQEVAQYVAYEKECPHCKYKGFLIRTEECSSCSNPKASSIFEYVLNIKKNGERQSSSIQITGWTPYDKFEPKFEGQTQPLNFSKIFVPDSFEEQARKLKVENPWKEEGADEYKEYNTKIETAPDDDIPF